MSFWSSLQSAIEVVSGNTVKVQLEGERSRVAPGERVTVRIICTAGAHTVKARALELHVVAREKCVLPAPPVPSATGAGGPIGALGAAELAVLALPPKSDVVTYQSKVVVAPSLEFVPGQRRVFEGTFVVPPEALPTYRGKRASHEWTIEARLDVFGADPTSGPYGIAVVGAR